MGNVLLRRGVDGRHRIKIMKADGTVMKVRGPLCVKEILIDYPNHEMFEAPAGPPLGMGSLSRPLPDRAELVAAHLYYLIPLPLESDEFMIYDSNRAPFAKAASRSVPSRSCSSEPRSYAGTTTDSVKEEEEIDPVVNKINRGGLSVVSSSYGSTVRLKLRLREDELASFLSANNLRVENVVVPTIIKRATRQSALSPWIQSRRPIVPIVLTGTHLAWKKNSLHVRPAPLTVTYLPPIRTDDWTIDKVDDYVEMLHSIYVENLPDSQRPL